MKPAIVLMAKNPIAGHVKTRLAKDLGQDKALEIYLQLLEHTTDVMSKSKEAEHIIYHSPELIKSAEWTPPHFKHKLQTKGNLGKRMRSAIEKELELHNKVIVIGADCMPLKNVHLDKAFQNLDYTDVVLGPSTDGGYYLIGLNANQPSLFKDIDWSTTKVFEQTLDKIEEKGLSVAILEELYDIDFKEDWERWKSERQ